MKKLVFLAMVVLVVGVVLFWRDVWYSVSTSSPVSQPGMFSATKAPVRVIAESDTSLYRIAKVAITPSALDGEIVISLELQNLGTAARAFPALKVRLLKGSSVSREVMVAPDAYEHPGKLLQAHAVRLTLAVKTEENAVQVSVATAREVGQ